MRRSQMCEMYVRGLNEEKWVLGFYGGSLN